MKISCIKIKKFLIFFPKKLHSEKCSCTFQPNLKTFPKKKFLYFFLIKPSLKKFLIFQEMDLSSLRLKK